MSQRRVLVDHLGQVRQAILVEHKPAQVGETAQEPIGPLLRQLHLGEVEHADVAH